MSGQSWDWLDESQPLRHPSVLPRARGWYVRDWRGQRIDAADRVLAVDLWEPVPDRADVLYPGVWYVLDGGINDASVQVLPWRELTQQELNVFSVLYRRQCIEVMA